MPQGSEPDAPLATMAQQLIGPAGLVILSLTALASVGGNLLGSMTSTPRALFALGERRLVPRWFAAVDRTWHTPADSILFMGLAAGAPALSGSFVWLAVVSTLARLFVYSASIAALPAARRAHGLRLGAPAAAAMAGGLAICAWAAAQSELRSWLMLGGLLAVGLVLYAVSARGRRLSPEAGDVSAIQPPPSTREPS